MDAVIGRGFAWVNQRPWMFSLLLVLAVAVPGLLRVEQIAHQARNAATAAQSALESDCRTSNAGRLANQDTWASLFDSFERLAGPDGRAAVDQLRADVVLLEPVDCDGDGDVDGRDIDQDPSTTRRP